MRYLFISFLIVTAYSAHAQYWFGPKIGGHYTDYVYQESDYKMDSFDVSPDFGGIYGLTVIYQATEKYAVQGELSYFQVNRNLKNFSDSDLPVVSKIDFRYLSLPISFRFNFGGTPVHYYIAGGPILNFWLGGRGEIYVQDFEEEDGITEPVPYKLVFNQDKGGTLQHRAVTSANRIQYGLQASAGVYFDLMSAGRFLLDVKYSFGHSNMAFNDNPDFVNFDYYSENFRFRNNTLAISIAYLFLYDSQLIKKGSSTSDLTKEQRKEGRKRFTNRKKFKKN